MRHFLLVCSLLLTITPACAHKTIMLDGFEIDPAPWQKDQQAIAQRASFDLNCDANSLNMKIIAIAGAYGLADWVSQVGVSGCGQSGVYVRTQQGWLLNSTRADEPR